MQLESDNINSTEGGGRIQRRDMNRGYMPADVHMNAGYMPPYMDVNRAIRTACDFCHNKVNGWILFFI